MGTSNKNALFEGEEHKKKSVPSCRRGRHPCYLAKKRNQTYRGAGTHWPTPWLKDTLANPMAESVLWPIHSQLDVWGALGSQCGISPMSAACLEGTCEGRRVRLSELRNLSSVTGYINSQNKKPPMKKVPFRTCICFE